MQIRLLTIIVPVLTTLLFGAWGCILGPLLPAIARELRVPVEVTGTLLSIYFAGSLVSVTAGGILADRYGKKRIFLIALGGFTIFVFLFARAPSMLLLGGACLIAGAFGAVLEGLCGALITDFQPHRRDRNMNLLQVAFSLGATVAIGLVGWLLGTGGAWRLAYTVLAGLAALTWMLGLFMYDPHVEADDPISLHAVRGVVTNPLIVLLIIAIALYVGSELSLAQWISPILERKEGYPAPVAVWGAALFWLATGIGRLTVGLLCRHIAGTRVLGWLLAGGLLAYLVLLLPLGPWRLWAGTILAGLTFSGVWPLIVSIGSAHYPAYSGTVVSLLVACGGIGGLIFPVIAGYVVERISYQWGFALMAALFVALALVTRVYLLRHPAEEETVTP